jgi:hypothetical protein
MAFNKIDLWTPDIIEHPVAHSVQYAFDTAYDWVKFLKKRQAMMQQWTDYLAKCWAGAVVQPTVQRQL